MTLPQRILYVALAAGWIYSAFIFVRELPRQIDVAYHYYFGAAR